MIIKPSSPLLNYDSGISSMDLDAHERCELPLVRARIFQIEAERMRGVKPMSISEARERLAHNVSRGLAAGGEMDG